jgi:hypothetical protein
LIALSRRMNMEEGCLLRVFCFSPITEQLLNVALKHL